jgi:hypothetical protein
VAGLICRVNRTLDLPLVARQQDRSSRDPSHLTTRSAMTSYASHAVAKPVPHVAFCAAVCWLRTVSSSVGGQVGGLRESPVAAFATECQPCSLRDHACSSLSPSGSRHIGEHVTTQHRALV